MSVEVFTCPPGSGAINSNATTGVQTATCNGGGQWQSAEALAWWGVEIPPGQVSALFTAIFLFAAIVMVCRAIDRTFNK